MANPIKEKDWKLLIAASGGKCAFPNCSRSLFEDSSENDDPVFVGEFAHIIAKNRTGPRGHLYINEKNKNSYTNLILLCRNHHKIVDSQPNTYSVPVLHEMKRLHEHRMKNKNDDHTRDDENIQEEVYSTFLSVIHIPQKIYSCKTKYRQQNVHKFIEKIGNIDGILTPFVLIDKKFYTFCDIYRKENPFESLCENSTDINVDEYSNYLQDDDLKKIYIRLLNASLKLYLSGFGVSYDRDHYRYYFLSKEGESKREIKYQTIKGRSQKRNVVWNPKFRQTGESKNYWIHLAANIHFHHVGDYKWGLSIRPERLLTKDGTSPLESRKVGRKITRIKSTMYNENYFNEVNFWRDFMLNQQPRITLEFGNQALVISPDLIKFDIVWPKITGDIFKVRYNVIEDDLFTSAKLTKLEKAEYDDFNELEDYE